MRGLRHSDPVVGWTVLAASVIAIGASVVTGVKARDHAHCQASVNEQVVSVIVARASAADERDAAWDKFVDQSLAASSKPERDAALDEWKASRAAIAEKRRAHPLPTAPVGATC